MAESDKLIEFRLEVMKDFLTYASDNLQRTSLRSRDCPRAFYLENALQSPPPLVVYSHFVPLAMAEHLMRKKKPSALGVKFQAHNTPLDEITNMEGLLHTYVTPIVPVKIHGDYRFRGGHGVVKFLDENDKQKARHVLLSASVQPDFEDSRVMVALAALEREAVVGLPLSSQFTILDGVSKQDHGDRVRYEAQLRSHVIAHLVEESRLPALEEVSHSLRSIEECCEVIENFIASDPPPVTDSPLRSVFVKIPNNKVISAEILGASAYQQARNEITALETICAQGYVYTSDPPSIFAQQIGAKLLNRFQIFGLKCLLRSQKIERMKIFAFNDYADPSILSLLQCIFRSHNVLVMAKADLFNGVHGSYNPPHVAQGAILVIHNNSDGFGQNIETEHESGSLDGAIGANSSAAASLKRDRNDLMNYRYRIPE